MHYNLSAIKKVIIEAVRSAGFEVNEADVHVEKTKTLEHGHFATNVAMLLAGALGKNPREVAESIAGVISGDLIKRVEVAGIGFINLFVEQKFYTRECRSLIANTDEYLQNSLDFKPAEKTMVIDTSHPNVAKPMGVHHLLSTIIGSSLTRIYRKYGYKVINDNYLGDWGTQFGKLIHAIHTWGNRTVIEADPIRELLALYVKFHEEVKKDPSIEDNGRAEFKKLEDGDSGNRELLDYIVGVSMREFNKLYDRLDVSFDVINGESFYEDKMQPILKMGREKGIIIDGKKGAWIVPPNNPEDPPAVVRKSDGATLYITRDLARIDYWEKTWHPDLMVNVVDVAQSLHFRQLFDVADKLHLTTASNPHVSFGRMSFKDRKMSTRKGDLIRLSEVLDEAEERALKLARKRALELSSEEQKELARIMGIGAVKYNVLSQNRIHDMIFDWDIMLSFEGNSAPYLMYTTARAKSVLAKDKISVKDCAGFELALTEDHETGVMLSLMMFPDVFRRSADDFKPNHLATYLYGLAQDYNTMYNALPILKADDEATKETRLALTAGVIAVMAYGLDLLGIEVPERM